MVLSVEDYRRLMDDVHDLGAIAERRDESTVGFEELKRRLRADRVLQR